MGEENSSLETLTNGQEPTVEQEVGWKDFTLGEKFLAGLFYTNLIIAPVVNVAIYATLAGYVIYSIATK